LAKLRNWIYDKCNCKLTITFVKLECINETAAQFNVKLSGFMATNIEQYLLLVTEVELENVKLYLCNQQCTEIDDHEIIQSKDQQQNDTSINSDNDNNATILILMVTIIILLVMLTMIIIILKFSRHVAKSFIHKHTTHIAV